MLWPQTKTCFSLVSFLSVWTHNSGWSLESWWSWGTQGPWFSLKFLIFQFKQLHNSPKHFTRQVVLNHCALRSIQMCFKIEKKWIIIKQRLLVCKFGKCKYLPKNVHFLVSTRFPQNDLFGILWYSPDSPDLLTFTSTFARTCQTCERRIWRELHKFSKCRLDHFIYIKYAICE